MFAITVWRRDAKISMITQRGGKFFWRNIIGVRIEPTCINRRIGGRGN